MSKHSLAQAEGRLAELIDRAHRGEKVVITRGDEPWAEITPLTQPVDQPRNGEFLRALDQLAELRGKQKPLAISAASVVSAMRDEDER